MQANNFWLDYGNNEFVVPYRNKNLNGIELGRDWRLKTLKIVCYFKNTRGPICSCVRARVFMSV